MDMIVEFLTYHAFDLRISWDADDAMDFPADLKEFKRRHYKSEVMVLTYWEERGYYITLVDDL